MDPALDPAHCGNLASVKDDGPDGRQAIDKEAEERRCAQGL